MKEQPLIEIITNYLQPFVVIARARFPIKRIKFKIALMLHKMESKRISLNGRKATSWKHLQQIEIYSIVNHTWNF